MERLTEILTSGKKMPELVVFDLDETLWPFWCISHVKKPIKKCPITGYVKANDGQIVSLYQGAHELLHKLHNHGLTLGIASKTPVEKFATEVLAALNISEFFTYSVMVNRVKTHHFTELSKQSAVDFKDMLFFDDNAGNIYDINRLGVTTVHVENGLCLQDVINGFEKFSSQS